MLHRKTWLTVTLLVATIAPGAKAAEATVARSGVIEFQCAPGELNLPERFRLPPHEFEFSEAPLSTVARNVRMSKVTFPSPVVTPHENNNTVHCEYFCQLAPGDGATGARVPGVIVLHILGGDFDLSRLFCRTLASRGVAALFLKMPYYGERRQPDSPARMVSVDPEETVRGMTQAVLDVRQAAAWLGSQHEVDAGQLGIMGISLGGITSALASGVEPRFHKVCLILAGGDMGEVAWTSEELAPLRQRWIANGGTKEQLFALFRPVDPITYARPVPGRKILMLNARHDEVVPPGCTEALWRAYGEPPIIWWNAGHYSAARYLFDGMAEAVKFFQPDATRAAQSTAK
ncbi:MAG: alpha/beta hydrolase family protein [Pirellulales bacterium]